MNMNEDTVYDAMDKPSSTIGDTDEFLSSNIGTVVITDETETPAASSPLIAETSHQDGDNTFSSFVTIPEVISNTAVSMSGVEPLKIIPIEDNCSFATEPMGVPSNYLDYSITNDGQRLTTIIPPTEESQVLPVINYCSPLLLVMKHPKELTSHQNIDGILPEFQFSQQVQQGYASTMQPDINNTAITLPQQWSLQPSNISEKSPYETFIADPMTTVPGSSSAVQTNSMWTITSNNQQSQNTATSHKLVPGTSLVTGVQTDSVQTMNSLGQQNASFVDMPIRYDIIEHADGKFAGKQILIEYNILDTADKTFECNGRSLVTEVQVDSIQTMNSLEQQNANLVGEPTKYDLTADDEIFGSQQISKEHNILSTADKPFECNICHSKFTTKVTLNRHYCIDTAEKQFECNVCQKKFRWKQSLSTHYHIHTGEKPYECNICLRKFTQKVHMNEHYRTHTGEKPYECIICHTKFTKKTTLNVHYRRIHSGEKLYI